MPLLHSPPFTPSLPLLPSSPPFLSSGSLPLLPSLPPFPPFPPSLPLLPFLFLSLLLSLLSLSHSFTVAEVEASDRSAIEAVLSADKKRLALLEEEKALVACSDANTERLKQVGKAVASA